MNIFRDLLLVLVLFALAVGTMLVVSKHARAELILPTGQPDIYTAQIFSRDGVVYFTWQDSLGWRCGVLPQDLFYRLPGDATSTLGFLLNNLQPNSAAIASNCRSALPGWTVSRRGLAATATNRPLYDIAQFHNLRVSIGRAEIGEPCAGYVADGNQGTNWRVVRSGVALCER